MNRGVIFAAVMVAVILLTVGGMIAASATGGGQSLAATSDEVFEGVSALAADADSAAVVIGPSPDGKAHVQVTSQRRYACRVEQGKLTFHWEEHAFFFNNWGEKVEILLPAGVGEVTVYASSGRIEVTGIACASLLARSSSGGLQARDIACEGEVSLTASSGSVRAQGIQAQSLRLQTSSGGISAQEISSQDVWAKASSGGIQLSLDDRAQALEASTSSGSIRAALAGPVQGNIQTSSGGVRVEAARGQSVYCQTRSGGIRLNGERVSSDGRQGGYVLEGEEGELRVETSSGGIRIEH